MAINITRRKFNTALGGATATWPLAVRAQQRPMPVIGFLNGASPEAYALNVTGFLQGLKETATLKAKTLRSNTVGQRVSTIG